MKAKIRCKWVGADPLYIEYHDLWFFMQDGSVTGILVIKPFYRFANGLKMGDSKEDIIQTFGYDFILIDSGSEFILTYKDKGNLQYEATFSNWQLNPEIPVSVFEFLPPPKAAQISIMAN